MAAEEGASLRYRACPGYVAREIAGEYLLIPVVMQDGQDSKIAVLNETGIFLWEQLSRECSLEDLIHAMTEEYQVSSEEAYADIMEFVNAMQVNKLVQESGGEE